MAGMGTDTSSAAQYAQPDASESKHNLNNLDFNAQVEHILSQHAAIAADIRERDNIRRDKTAHPLAQIKITARIDARIQQVREDMEVLNTIYDRIKSAKRHRKKHTEEELQKFEDTIRNLEEHCNTYDSNKYRRMKTVKRRVQLDLSAPEGEETPTEEDQLRASDSIKRWHTRDVHFDQQLQEIGEAVERIGEVAAVIGERSSVQAKNAISTMHKVQETTSDVTAVSHQIRTLIRKQKTVECTFRIGLIVVFIATFAVFIYALIRVLKR